MKNELRIIGWFVGLLVGALALDYAFLWVRSTLFLAFIKGESPAWSILRTHGVVEGIYWLLCFAFFASAGAVLSTKTSSLSSAVLLASLLGLSFTVVVWLEGPHIAYSHAPLRLWALAWADLYVPTIASGLGALLWWIGKGRLLHAPDANQPHTL